MKITLLLDYPDEATPGFTADMELHGGKVEVVQFSDLFREYEALEEAARLVIQRHDSGRLSDPGDSRSINDLRAIVCPETTQPE